MTQIAAFYHVPLPTLSRLTCGHQTIVEFNAGKQFLTAAEEAVLEKYLIGSGKRGFPLTLRMIHERARSMLEKKRGKEVELGREWTNRFMRRHPNLQTYRATPLDRIRANGLNPTVLKDYEDTVEELFTLHNPPEQNIFGADEVATNLLPSLHIDGELGVDWIRHFDEATKDRVGVRFQFVDDHSSHCTVEFLDYAAEHDIIVISYPPHTTHALQGLDVACFGPLKLYWSLEKTKWERLKKRRLGKNDFLEVYSLARRRAFTEKTIKSAFRTMGLVPFRRAAIEPDKMAPALVDSAKGGFPLPLPTPARAVLAFHRQVLSGPGDKVISAHP
ncbi:hypothetical protein FRC04_005067 [Tulasnella sp. 424]|nr:hypothetical protein FRC04_005067 [Tulasnella sp. 424]KAG8963006.1 hypothetical protein FRC05_004957 [Tulasnella sp. 425]